MKPLGCECSDCPRCNGTVNKLSEKVSELRQALIKIYDAPSKTDTIRDIAYDALGDEVKTKKPLGE